MDLVTIVSITGLAIAIAGLAVSLNQLSRTSRAVEAADEAAKRTEREAAQRHLISLAPALAQADQSLEDAISYGNRDVALRELTNLRLRASEAKGFLNDRGKANSDLIKCLQATVAQSAIAKRRVMEGKMELGNATKRVQKEAAECVAMLTEYTGSIKGYSQDRGRDD